MKRDFMCYVEGIVLYNSVALEHAVVYVVILFDLNQTCHTIKVLCVSYNRLYAHISLSLSLPDLSLHLPPPALLLSLYPSLPPPALQKTVIMH